MDGEQVVSVAADNATLELAVGKVNGSVTLWDTQTWSIKAVLQSELGGSTCTLKYSTVKTSKSTQTILLVGCTSYKHTSCDLMTRTSRSLRPAIFIVVDLM